MLTIRREQMQTLDAAALAAYVSKAIPRLAQKYPARFEAGNRPANEKVVRDGIAKAAVYLIEEAPMLERFFDFWIGHAPDFDTDPDWDWTLDILEDAGLSAEAKLHLLESTLGYRS